MPTSATGEPAHRAGFTLIEILVVLAILGLAASMAFVQFRHGAQARLEEDAQRLAALLQHVREEALVGGRPLAWRSGAGGYAFFERGAEGWVPIEDDPRLRPRSFPPNVMLEGLRVAGASVPAGTPLVFMPAVVHPPFEIVLAAGPHRVALSGPAAGRITVKR